MIRCFIVTAVMVICSSSCLLFEKDEYLKCRLVELRKNPNSEYYDARVKLEWANLEKPFKNRFYVRTPTKYYEMEDLTFLEDGKDPAKLESGDVFLLPLGKPDWKFYIGGEKYSFYCSTRLSELLPEEDRWHPIKSEAMKVARSIKVRDVDGGLKPVPTFLPAEWRLAGAEAQSGRYRTVQYLKLRVGEVKEDVTIRYTLLTDDETKRLETTSETELLTDWTPWARKAGKPGEVAGHTSVYWDMSAGIGRFGWSYRYAYIDRGMFIEVTLQPDPLEWVKTDQDKEYEKKTRRIFLKYEYGPVGKPEWHVIITIRKNGEGNLHKESKRGITIEKRFKLSRGELDNIQKALQKNHFFDLGPRSGPSGGVTSSIMVKDSDKSHSVEMRDATIQPYSNIEKVIRKTLLPKVGEGSTNISKIPRE